MPSPFDALDGALSRAVMGAFGEVVPARLRPRSRSEFAEGGDPHRPDVPLRGIFTEAHDTAQLRGAALASEHSGVTRLSTQMAEFFVPAASLAHVPYAIRQGDKLTFDGRPGAPTFAVSDIQRSDTGDLNLLLVPAA